MQSRVTIYGVLPVSHSISRIRIFCLCYLLIHTWMNIFLFLKGNILRPYIYFFGEVQSKIRCQTYRNEMLNYGKHIWQFKIHYFFAVCLSEFLKEKTVLPPLLQIVLWDGIVLFYSPGNLLVFLLLEKLVLVWDIFWLEFYFFQHISPATKSFYFGRLLFLEECLLPHRKPCHHVSKFTVLVLNWLLL